MFCNIVILLKNTLLLKFEEVINYLTNYEKTRQLDLAHCPWNNHFPNPRKEEEI